MAVEFEDEIKMVMAPRYKHLLDVVHTVKPKTILEIGVWNGFRGMQLSHIAYEYNKGIKYIGYDLFESGDDETNEKEKNVKPNYHTSLVTAYMERFKSYHPGFEYELIKGNTNETLKPQSVDLAFIDGGHLVETIQSDYDNLKDSKNIVFDDYYTGGIDIEKYGCNKVIEGLEYILFPTKDPVLGGGFVQMAAILE